MAAAKKERRQLTDEEKAERRARQQEKYSTPQDQYILINTTELGKGKDKMVIETHGLGVRGEGVHVRTVNITTGHVSSEFIPFVKIKKKSAWYMLVGDKNAKADNEE